MSEQDKVISEVQQQANSIEFDAEKKLKEALKKAFSAFDIK